MVFKNLVIKTRKRFSVIFSIFSLFRNHPKVVRNVLIGFGAVLLLSVGARAMVNFVSVLRLTPLAVTVVPQANLSPSLQSQETQTVGLAFDRDTITSYTAFGNSQVTVAFEGTEEIHQFRLYGSAPYTASVSWVNSQGNVTAISQWTNLNLNNLSSGWNTFTLNTPVNAQSLVISLVPTNSINSQTVGIQEMEFWGKGIPQNETDGEAWDTFLNSPTAPSTLLVCGREYAASAPVTGSNAVTVGAANGPATVTFTVNLPMNGQSYRKAWLMYNVNGLSSWINVPRVINGNEAAGGWPMAGSTQWSTQVEEINPVWLNQGANTISFSMPTGQVNPYMLQGLKIVAEEDNGSNLIDDIEASAGDASVLTDGDLTTGWRPYVDGEGAGVPSLTMNLARTAQVSGVNLYSAGSIPGAVIVSVLQSGVWTRLGDATNGAGLSAGWQTLNVNTTNPVDGVSLQFKGGDGSSGQIMEAMVVGSGIGGPYGATMEITYPDQGEFFGREAYIRGFLGLADDGSGAAQVLLGGQAAQVINGQFEGIVSKDQVGLSAQADDADWAVTVTAVYPDGKQLTEVVNFTDQVSSASPGDGGGTYAQMLNPGQDTIVNKMGLQLTLDSASVTQAVNLQMVPLATTDLAPMDPGMTNVTGGTYRGYRMLPHGTHFANKIKLKFAYDPTLLPAGKTAKDVRTYFFDPQRGHWMPLEVSTLDETGQTLESLTNHFTDFVNATITTPDHPDDVSFNPNQIKDIKAADPGSQINLIEPPQVNNQGTADLSYLIEVPPGRKGIQPQLTLKYDSGGGDSWTGMGWDLSCEQITVETRWGAPRYWNGTVGPNQETETYLLNGEMLVEENPPGTSLTTYVAHRPPSSTGFISRAGSANSPVTFRTRTEGKFQRILRYGSEPNNYYWEVDEKDGIRMFFGARAGASAAETGNGDSAVLTTDVGGNAGNIFVWALREMVDLHGNNMFYHYNVAQTNVWNNSSPTGHEIYPDHIYYTGTGGADSSGNYEVDFIHSAGRPDVMVNAKGGFARVTTDRLNEIDVKLNAYNGILPNQLIRSYLFTYQTGAFSKSLLTSVQQMGPNNTPFPGNTHTFTYFNQIQPDPVNNPGLYNGFSAVAVNPPQTNVGTGVSGLLAGDANALNTSSSTEVGGHIYLGVGLGFGKGSSAGVKFGYNSSDNTGALQLIDVNGDGLPDLVYKKSDGNLYYRANLNGPSGTLQFSGTEMQITGINDLSRDHSSMTSGGAEAYAFGANLITNLSGGTDSQSIYMTDVNGDGIPDLVNNGTVYFGNPPDASGNIKFTTGSGTTPNPLGAGSPIQDPGLSGILTNLFTQQATSDPLVDTIKQWNAPYTGTVNVSALVTLIPPPATQMSNYEAAGGNPDGVRITVEQATGDFPSTAVPVTVLLIPSSAAGTPQPINLTGLPVNLGDRLYFREQSVFDGKFDQVTIDPQIQYTQINGLPATSTLDENNLDATHYQSSSDFVLAGRHGLDVTVPLTGVVKVTGDFQKLAATSDSVTVLVIKNELANGVAQTPVTEFVKELDFSQANVAANYGPSGSDFLTFNVTNIQTSPEPCASGGTAGIQQSIVDNLQFMVMVDSNIDLTKLSWDPQVSYVSVAAPTPDPCTGVTPPAVTVTNPNGSAAITFGPSYDIEFYPENDLGTPQQALTVTDASGLALNPILQLNTGDNVTSGTVYLTVKKNGLLVAKDPIDISQQDGFGNVIIPALNVSANVGDVLFFNYTTRDEALIFDSSNPGNNGDLTNFDLQGNYADQSGNPNFEVPFEFDSPNEQPDAFPAPYRGWAVAGMNGNPSGSITSPATGSSALAGPVNENNFVEPTPPNPSDPNYQAELQTEIQNLKFYTFIPNPSTNQWAGPTTEIYATASGLSSARAGSDFIDVPNTSSFTGNIPNGAGAVGILRLSSTNQKAIGAGFIVSGSTSNGQGNGMLDFIDLNGDGYPDIVTQNNVQFTLPSGGLDGSGVLGNNIMNNTLRISTSSSINAGIGGNPADIFADSKGKTSSNDSGNGGSKGSTGGSQMPPLGFVLSGGVGVGTSDQTDELIDINGDGLPDKVHLNTSTGVLTVQLNTGYGFFTNPVTWANGGAVINHGSSTSGNIGIGFNDGIYGLAGGLTAETGVNTSSFSLMDINGNGLPDLVQSLNDGSGNLLVWFNTGSGFASPVTWAGGVSNAVTKSTNLTLGAGGYFTIDIPIFFISLIVNPGLDASTTSNQQTVMFSDLQGLGYPDQLESNGDGDLTAHLNNTGQTNLLNTVTRPMGGVITLNYARSGNTFANPHNRWNLANVTVFDGGQNANTAAPQGAKGADYQATLYSYATGVDSNGVSINAYDRFERDFLGYASVTETQMDTTNWEPSDGPVASLPPYRSVIRQYLNYNFYEKGLMTNELTQDANGNPFIQTANTYQLVDINSAGTAVPLPTLSENLPSNILFPQLITTTKTNFEGNASPTVATSQFFSYDAFGNVTGFLDTGDASETNSPVSVTIAYTGSNPSFVSPNYLVGLPVTMMATGSTGTPVFRHREATYSSSTGDLTEVRQYLADGTFAESDMTYDSNGNLITEIGPANLNSQRYTLNYTYDTSVATYPVKVTDSSSYLSTMAYDFRFGKPVKETDENSQSISTAYDEFGRTVTIVGPFEASTSAAVQFPSNYTISFDYHPDAAVPYAHTAHFDGFRDKTGGDPIETILYTDGLKRVLQTKKDDTLFTGKLSASAPMMTVSGRVVFDQVGRTISQFYPVTETKGSVGGNATFNTSYDTVLPTRMTYDVLDRNLVTTIPDNTFTTIAYTVSTDNGPNQLKTDVLDADSNKKDTFRDARELITQVNEYNGPTTVIKTTYAYDPVKQITNVIDTKGNQTTVAYDLLGRRTSITNPDTGMTQMTYDLASNVIKKVTANLQALGKAITYNYDPNNRLTNITYPLFTRNNVTYTYGTAAQGGQGNGNVANRIAQVTDGSGTELRLYDALGNIVKETKILQVPDEPNEPYHFGTDFAGLGNLSDGHGRDNNNYRFGFGQNNDNWGGHWFWGHGFDSGKDQAPSQGGSLGEWLGWGLNDDHPDETKNCPITFITQYTYDTWNRLQNMVYPDGELLNYKYDSGGLPYSVIGQCGTDLFQYVLRLEYDKFEQRVFVQNGNGTQQTYSYVPTNRRLTQLQALSGSVTFQNLNYSYDNVGNIMELANNLPTPELQALQAPVSQNFQYDKLYRLTNATGVVPGCYDPDDGQLFDAKYTLAMSYDNIHNITHKTQVSYRRDHDGTLNFGLGDEQSNLTYDWTYKYGSPHPHAPTQIAYLGPPGPSEGRNFSYDLNGNQLGYDTFFQPQATSFDVGPDRNIIWDEENRMVAVGDDDPGTQQTNSGAVHFVYNDQGTRVFKINGGNVNVYVNQFYTLQNLQQDAPTNGVGNDHVASKHIFIGSTRIASQVVNPKSDHEFDLGQGDGEGVEQGHGGEDQNGHEHSWQWGNDEGDWNHFCEHTDKNGDHEGDDDQIQFVTALTNGVTVYRKQSTSSTTLGTLQECQTATLDDLRAYNGFYAIDFNGQKGFVSSASVTVGIPASCAGVSPTTSVLPQDDFVFFYHTDQVGSTGYMTDGSGRITEHLEYIPFGETWIQSNVGTTLFPDYQFSSKELDEETGLYYFGARYYDPRTSVWQSVDPILVSFLPDANSQIKLTFKREPIWKADLSFFDQNGLWRDGGIYNSTSLALYSYVGQNPLRYIDPDGKDWIPEYAVSMSPEQWKQARSGSTVQEFNKNMAFAENARNMIPGLMLGPAEVASGLMEASKAKTMLQGGIALTKSALAGVGTYESGRSALGKPEVKSLSVAGGFGKIALGVAEIAEHPRSGLDTGLMDIGEGASDINKAAIQAFSELGKSSPKDVPATHATTE